MSAALGFVQGKPRPKGTWKACAPCGTTGVRTRIAIWHGTEPQRKTGVCRSCDGSGWVTAPWYYSLPVSQWPAE